MNRKSIFLVGILFIILLIICPINAGFFDFFGGDDNSVRIGYIPSDHDAALFVADANGDYEKEGLTLDLVKFNNGKELMDALDNNEIDVGFVSVAPALYSISSGGHSKIISSVQNEGSGLVISNTSEISQSLDLQGKSIAIPGEHSIQDLLLSYYLDSQGLSLDDLEVSYPQSSSIENNLINGEIDGVMIFQPIVAKLSSDGNEIFVNSSEIFPNHPCCVMVASDNFINDNLGTVKKIVAIHKNATMYINDNIKHGTTNHIVDLLPNDVASDKNLEINSLESLSFTSGISDDFKSNVLILQKVAVERDFIKNPLSQDKIFLEV